MSIGTRYSSANEGQFDPNTYRTIFGSMAEEPDSIVLRYLRSIDTKVDGVIADVREIKTRVGILEQQYASISSRIDRIDARLDRIERRLDLVHAGDVTSIP
jgi:hypothetical protein